MERPTANLKRLAIAVIIIAVSAIGAKALVYRKGPPAKVPDTAIRKKLLKLRKTTGLSAASIPMESVRYSGLVYDLEVTKPVEAGLPWSGSVPVGPDGLYSFVWRIKLTFNARFSMVTEGPEEGLSVSLTDRKGLPVYRKTEALTLPGGRVDLAPDIYILRVTSKNPLGPVRAVFAADAGKTPAESRAPELKRIDLRFSPGAYKEFRRLVGLAGSAGKGDIIKMPGGRVKGEIFFRGRKAGNVRTGLSGRTREHLKWFPSIDVKVSGGRTFEGIPAFKLYRLDTKEGIYEFIFMTVLRDMGFLVPRIELVDLRVNGVTAGVYLLMETQSPAVFANNRLPEGDITGVEPEKFFFDYPFGASLDVRYFFRAKDSGYGRVKRGFFFSEDFSRRLERRSMAAYIAFASAYYSAHGLGIDDLRFYRNPATNLFTPIPRDLNPGLWGTDGAALSYLTHLGWNLSYPAYTVWPVKTLYRGGIMHSGGGNYFHGGAAPSMRVGLTDIHPAVIGFLSDSRNLSLVNGYLKYFLRNDALRKKITTRAAAALRRVLAAGGDSGILSDQLSSIIRNGPPGFASEGVGLAAPERRFLLRDRKGRGFFWNIRTSTAQDGGMLPGFTAPMPFGADARSYMEGAGLNFLVERRIFGLLEEGGIRFSKRTYAPAEGGPGYEEVSLKGPGAERPEERGPVRSRVFGNVATYLGTRITGGRAVVLFLVRNAGEEASRYALAARDGFSSYRPAVNRLFTVPEGARPGRATLEDIFRGRFVRGERLRLLAFRMTPGKTPFFYRLDVPEGAYYWFPPYMYLPSRPPQGASDNVSGRLPEWVVERGDGLYVPRGTVVTVTGDNFIDTGGKALFVGEGVTFRMAGGSSIRVSGDLHIEGSAKNPVRFVSGGERPWGGLYAGGPSGRSRVVLKNVRFDNFGTFPKTGVSGLKLTGGLTFYNVDIYMEGVRISNARGEDALNLIHSTAEIRDTVVTGTFSDGIDMDFSEAKISGLRVERTGGDGLDLSNSLVSCRGSTFSGSSDKGVSIGEMSNVFISGSIFTGNKTGIANKDQSFLSLRDSEFRENGTALAEFIKKPYFGRPGKELAGISYKNNEKRYSWLGFYSY